MNENDPVFQEELGRLTREHMKPSRMTIEVSRITKSEWVRAAQASKDGPGLADWVIASLDRSAQISDTGITSHPVEATKVLLSMLGLEMTSEYEAQMRKHCPVPFNPTMRYMNSGEELPFLDFLQRFKEEEHEDIINLVARYRRCNLGDPMIERID